MAEPVTDDSTTSGNTAVSAPINPRETVGFWLKWIRAAKKGQAEKHRRNTSDAWREFLRELLDNEDSATLSTPDNNSSRPYPAYWAAVNTIEPALYSRTPDLVTERRFDINDPIAETMSLLIERLGKYLMENSNFDDVMSMAVADFIHGSKATTQVIYEAAFNTIQKSIALSKAQDADNDYLDENGELYNDEVQQDSTTGFYFGTSQGQELDEDSQKIYLAPVCYDEVLHTPSAKLQCDITEMAYFFCYSKEEALKKFDEAALQGYSWKASYQTPNKNNSDSSIERDKAQTGEQFIDGWEIFCLVTKKVYWVSEGCPNIFLKAPVDDPYGLKSFYPSPPFIIQGKPSKNMYPTPMWVHLRPGANQLHLMYERVFKLIDAVRRRAIVDGDETMVTLLNSGDLEFISAASLKSIVEKGGLENMIYYLPVKELVDAIGELNNQEQVFVANFEKWAGVPDILQGLSDPIETLGAQEIKAQAGHDRFKNAKKKVQQLARDSIEMMIDLALKVFSDQKIATVTGMQYMDQNDQANFSQALLSLRNDESRTIRVGIDTDSMTFVDQGLKTQRMNAAITTVNNGLKQASDMLAIDPSFAATTLKTVLLSLDASDIGKQFVDEVKADVNELIQKATAPKQPPGPPPIDPTKQLEIQTNATLKTQQMQMDHEYRMAQLNLMAGKNQTDAQIKSGDQNLKAADQTLKSQDQQIEVEKLDLAAQTHADTAALQSRSLDIQAGAASNDIAVSQFEAGLEQESLDFKKKFDTASLVKDTVQSFIDTKQRVVEHADTTAIAAHDSVASAALGVHERLVPNLPPIHAGVSKPKPPSIKK